MTRLWAAGALLVALAGAARAAPTVALLRIVAST